MNICTKCGNPLKPNARFCGKCGQLATAEINPLQVLPKPEPVCTNCGTKLAPGIKFCTSCGAPMVAASPPATPAAQPGVVNPTPVQTPPPPRPSVQPRTQVPPSAKPPKKKKGKKILVFVVSAIVLLAAAAAAVYFFGTYKPKETFADLSGLYEDEKYDQDKIDSVATAVEDVFLNADTVKLAEILSPTTLEQKREFFGELQPHMAAFGNDFKTRKFLYATPRFAVYEFSSADGTFTAEFCLGEDGTWKLMRF